MAHLPPLPITLPLAESARQLAAEHTPSFYDALIIAAALQAGCTTLLTEDMQEGRRITAVSPPTLSPGLANHRAHTTPHRCTNPASVSTTRRGSN
jgi:hypothetical protein